MKARLRDLSADREGRNLSVNSQNTDIFNITDQMNICLFQFLNT